MTSASLARGASLALLWALGAGCAGRGCGQRTKPAERPLIAPDAAALQRPFAVLSGRLTDPSGRGLPRVRVLALGVDGRGLALTDTGPDGRYRLEVPPGPVHLETRARGRVPRAIDVTAPAEVADGALAEGVAIEGRLADGDGRAIGPEAAGMVIARVEPRWLPDTTPREEPRPGVWRDSDFTSARTTAEGGFVLLGVPSGFHRLIAQAEGFAPVEVRHVLAPGQGVTIALARQVVLSGVVLDAAGAPASGATVEVAGSGLWPPRKATSDAKGGFVIEGLLEGIYEVRARRGVAEASPPLEGVERFGPDAAHRGQGEIALRLGPARPMRGRVTDVSTGAPIAGARVAIATDTLAALADRVTTGADGSFATPPLPPGAYAASASAPEHLPIWGERVIAPADAPATIELRLPRGAVIAGIVKDGSGLAVAGARLEVVTTTPTGLVVPVSISSEESRAEVWTATDPASPRGRLEPAGELGVLAGPIPFPPPLGAKRPLAQVVTPPAGAAGTLLTSADGRFRVSGLPAGKVRVVATHPQHSEGAGTEVVLAAGAELLDLTLILRRGAEVAGRVTGEDGLPLPNVLVSAAVLGAPEPARAATRLASMEAGDDADDTALGPGTVALTDFDGRYRLALASFGSDSEGRGPGRARLQGRVRVEATLQGFLPAAKVLRISAADADASRDLSVDFALVRADISLAGRVTDPFAFPLRGARVRLEAHGKDLGKRAGKTALTVDTDADGRFLLTQLPPPPWQLVITHADHPPGTVRVDSDRERPEFALAFGGGASGRVLDARTRGPLAGVTLRFSGPGGQTREARPDPVGAWSVLGLAEGAWTVTASAARHVQVSRAFNVVAGLRGAREIGTLDVDLELALAARISGRVVDHRGDPVAGAEVSLRALRGTPPLISPVRGTSDAAGAFVLERVAEGDYEVLASWRGGAAVPEEARVRAGDDVSGLLLRAR